MPSGCPCNGFASGTSSATLLLPTQGSVCCIDQLNSPCVAVVQIPGSDDCNGPHCCHRVREHERQLMAERLASQALRTSGQRPTAAIRCDDLGNQFLGAVARFGRSSDRDRKSTTSIRLRWAVPNATSKHPRSGGPFAFASGLTGPFASVQMEALPKGPSPLPIAGTTPRTRRCRPSQTLPACDSCRALYGVSWSSLNIQPWRRG